MIYIETFLKKYILKYIGSEFMNNNQNGNCECRAKNLTPQYTASVSEAYIQSKCCEYYIGTTKRIAIGNGVNGVVVLSNPKDSRVNLCVNKTNSSNLSNSPISVDVFSCAMIDGNLVKSYDYIQGNLACSELTKPKGQILYGADVNATNGVHIQILTIPPFQVLKGNTSGSVIIPPGAQRIYVFQTINIKETATIAMGLAWWEESVCANNSNCDKC